MIWLHRNQAFRILPGYNRKPLNDFSTNSEIISEAHTFNRSRDICITVLRRLFPLETAWARHVVPAKYTYLDLACWIPVEVQFNKTASPLRLLGNYSSTLEIKGNLNNLCRLAKWKVIPLSRQFSEQSYYCDMHSFLSVFPHLVHTPKAVEWYIIATCNMESYIGIKSSVVFNSWMRKQWTRYSSWGNSLARSMDCKLFWLIPLTSA